MAKGEMLARWLKLLIAIQGGRPYGVRELADRMGVSPRTIFRDLAGLQNAGVPLYFDPDRKTYRLTESFQIPPLHFSPDELGSLVTALNFARRSGPMRSRRTAVALMDKLLAAMPIGQRLAAGRLDEALVVEPLQARSFEDDAVVRRLEQAVGERRKVWLRYAAYSHGGTPSERVVRPFGLVHRGTSLYAIGYCELRRDIRTFRVGRIQAIRVLDQPFVTPDDFDLDRFLLQVWGITDGPELQVQLRFDAAVAPLARETMWHPTQAVAEAEGGAVLMTMTTRGCAELARWLAGYGGHVRVLAPPALAEAVVELARGILAAEGAAP